MPEPLVHLSEYGGRRGSPGDTEHTFLTPKGILALEVGNESCWLVIPGKPLDGYGQN